MLRYIYCMAVCLLALCAGQSVSAGDDSGSDWPQWRGPDRTGASTESDWPAASETEPIWRKNLGHGHSSFAVSDGRLFTLGYDADAGEDVVYCLDAVSGETVWTHRYGAEMWDYAHDGGTLTTPTVVGGVVFTSNREGKLFCLMKSSGDVIWSRDLRKEFEAEPHTWGFSASPLVIDGQVILNHGKVFAFEQESGELLWQTERHYGNAYSTPAAFEFEDQPMLAVLNGDGLVVISRDTGAEIAFHEWSKQPNLYPMTPVTIEGGRVFVSGGYDRGAAMLQLVPGDSGHELDVLWQSRVMRNKMSGCVMWGDHLYGFDESILKCIDLDGNELWRKRGLGTGSMSIAGGRLIIMTGRGDLVIANATPDDYEELSRKHVLDDGTYWTMPVLSHGLVYCRNSFGKMACVDFRRGPDVADAAEDKNPVALPNAGQLFAGHVEAVGGADALRAVRSAHFSGPGKSLRNTVAKGDVEVYWHADGGFVWVADSGFEFGHDQSTGWLVGTLAGPITLSDESLAAIREAGDLHRLLQPGRTYASYETTETTLFDDRPCYVVEAVTREGYQRRLYFEKDTGLYAGHEGDGIHMWVLRDYVETGDVLMPTHWALYEPESGEMDSASFETVVLNTLEESADAFDPPRIIELMNRTPEEIAAANDTLLEQHAELVGEWSMVDGPPDMGHATILVTEGFLQIEFPGGEPDPLSEPDEAGVMTLISFPDVKFQLERSDDGSVEAINIVVSGEPAARLIDRRPIDDRSAAAWPQFRGPGASGVATGPAAPIEWSVPDGHNLRWTLEIPGLAHSSPIIWGDRLFVTTAIGREDSELKVGLYGSGDPVADEGAHRFVLYCIDRIDGRILWERDCYDGIPKVQRHPKSTHANSTPATDGRHVVAFFGSEGLYCYTMDGDRLWSKDLGVLNAGAPGMPDYEWGFASSPIIHDGRVIIQCDVQDQSFLAAIDVETGEEIWRTNRDEPPTWCTPTVDVRDGRSQVIVNGYEHIGGYDLNTGEELWRMHGGGDVPVPTPVVAHDLIFITSAHGREAPVYAIHPTVTGEIADDPADGHMAWSTLKFGNYMQTPLVYGDELYCCRDNGVLSVYDARSGELHYRERLGSGRTGFSASAVASNDHVYLTSEEGEVIVMRAGPEFEIVARNPMGEICMATPAIADGTLYFRTRNHLVAIGSDESEQGDGE